MSKVSFIHHWHDRMELREALEGFRPQLELPLPEYTDSTYDSVFDEAQSALGLDELEPVYRDGKTILEAPDGYMFRVTGAFTLWPDGNSLEWGYGPPADSYEQWRRENSSRLAQLEERGYSPEAAEEEVAAWEDGNFDSRPPDLHSYSGKSLTLEFDRVTWGSLVPVDYKNRYSSDDKPATVTVNVSGFREQWHEQARRYIKLPNSESDRLLREHEYGEPGMIPCWKSSHVEGDIEYLQVELVPIEDGEGDTYIAPMQRLWVPENVRWAVYDLYPDLIDQHGDYNNRSGFGGAMRALGGIAAAFSGKTENAFDALAAGTDLAVIDNPMFAHMDTDRLVALAEQMIRAQNSKKPTIDERTEERKERAEEDFARKKNELVVITDVDQPLYELVRDIGESDEWLRRNVRYSNMLF